MPTRQASPWLAWNVASQHAAGCASTTKTHSRACLTETPFVGVGEGNGGAGIARCGEDKVTALRGSNNTLTWRGGGKKARFFDECDSIEKNVSTLECHACSSHDTFAWACLRLSMRRAGRITQVSCVQVAEKWRWRNADAFYSLSDSYFWLVACLRRPTPLPTHRESARALKHVCVYGSVCKEWAREIGVAGKSAGKHNTAHAWSTQNPLRGAWRGAFRLAQLAPQATQRTQKQTHEAGILGFSVSSAMGVSTCVGSAPNLPHKPRNVHKNKLMKLAYEVSLYHQPWVYPLAWGRRPQRVLLAWGRRPQRVLLRW